MKQLKFAAVFIGLFIITLSCNQPATDKTSEAKSDSTQPMTKADPVKLKEEIQALETSWSNADNARDVNALAAFYADDAVSLANNQPMLVGNASIRKDIEASIAKRPNGNTVAYEVMDAFGCDNYATEVGKTIRKDSTGKIISTGKYMAIWEKRNGKWICIRDIGNEDIKEK
jgi:uncharacterized protein (TIGR02246 family)